MAILDALLAPLTTIIDKVIPEPASGAHNDPEQAAATLKTELVAAFDELRALPVDRLLEERLAKYRRMGEFLE